MASGFDFISPGAAFADALTQHLAQQKADQRQQLIDSIAVRSENRAQQEADSMNQYRQAEMKNAQQQAQLARFNAISKNMTMGQDLSHLSPEDQQLFQSMGAAVTQPGTLQSAPITGQPLTPAVGTQPGQGTLQTGPMAAAQPSRLTYAGSIAEQEAAKERDQQSTIYAHLQQSGNPDDKAKAAYMDATRGPEGNVPTEVMAQIMAPPKHVFMFDQPSGKLVDTGKTEPFNSTVENRGYGPSSFWNPNEANDNWIVPGLGVVSVSKRNGNAIINGKPATPDQLRQIDWSGAYKPGSRPPAKPIEIKYGANSEKTSAAMLDAMHKNPTTDSAAGAQFAALSSVNTSSAPEKIKALAVQAITNPAGASEFMHSDDYNAWTNDEKTAFTNLYQHVWPKQAIDDYRKATQKVQGSGGFFQNLFGNPGSTQDQQ